MRKIYLIVVVIVMTAFAFFVRAGMDRTPQVPEERPAVAHSTRGAYANCLTCHANITGTHARFGNFEDCSACHAYPGPTPHGVEGAFADCLKCHGDIKEGHDRMFANYDNCLSCHEQQ